VTDEGNNYARQGLCDARRIEDAYKELRSKGLRLSDIAHDAGDLEEKYIV